MIGCEPGRCIPCGAEGQNCCVNTTPCTGSLTCQGNPFFDRLVDDAPPQCVDCGKQGKAPREGAQLQCTSLDTTPLDPPKKGWAPIAMHLPTPLLWIC